MEGFGEQVVSAGIFEFGIGVAEVLKGAEAEFFGAWVFASSEDIFGQSQGFPGGPDVIGFEAQFVFEEALVLSNRDEVHLGGEVAEIA